MASSRTYRVAEVAAFAGVTVRTLHHYDAIGLLTPSARSRAGYRLYTDSDLLRLQQVLIQRELGLALEEVRRVLDDPTFDLRQALIAQKSALQRRLDDCHAMLRAVDTALSTLEDLPAETSPQKPGKTTMHELFDGFDSSKHERETHARWGNTDMYAESKRRTSRYSEEDWARFKREQERVYAHLAELSHQKASLTSEEVRAAVEEHRALIDRWFYPCSREHHGRLADLYEADPRFAENIDRVAAGLTRYLVSAIRAAHA